MPEVTVLVVGSAGVGKSHFIRRALGLQSSARSVLSSRKMLIGGVIYMVRLVELELEHVDLDRDGHMRWPTAVDDVDIPHIDGALVLCDLNRPRSVDTVPALLRKLHRASLRRRWRRRRRRRPSKAVDSRFREDRNSNALFRPLLFVFHLLFLPILLPFWRVRPTHSLSSAQLPKGRPKSALPATLISPPPPPPPHPPVSLTLLDRSAWA